MMKLTTYLFLFYVFFLWPPQLTATEFPAVDAAPWVGVDFKGIPCNGRNQGFGPFDYTNPNHTSAYEGRVTKLQIVERAHFSPESENLIKPKVGSFLGDFAYTLMAWPNHHRALLSLIRFDLEVRNNIRKPQKKETEVECWFQRAIHFAPKDWITYSIYGHYLRKVGRFQESKSIYESALKLKSNDSKLEYAYSLLLYDMKSYKEAAEHAKKAYSNGKPPKSLKDKLIKLNVWD
jgi:tetratricopeptide (TPR) repeat protein